MWKRVVVGLIAMQVLAGGLFAEEPKTTLTAQADFFEAKVRPLLIAKCLDCHAGEEINGGLDLSSRVGWQAGGDSGKAIDLEHPAESRLLQAISYNDLHLQMPPEGKLSDVEIEVLTKWIQSGAYDPRVAQGGAGPKNPAEAYPELLEKHWAYQPLSKKLPLRTSIDQAILFESGGSSKDVRERATPEVLVRRLYFDLTGLPPSLDEFKSGVAMIEEGEYEELVDDLLGRREFAEHFARHYLDIVRYAESITLRGMLLPHAWRYRDYVIETFDRDLPLDEFLAEQIAGDLMETSDLETTSRRRVGSTFLSMGNHNWEEQDKKQLDMDIVDEQLNTIGQAFLGQTFGCARCHDHKFDPITTSDYYAMAGILKNARVVEHANISTPISEPLPMDDETARHFEDMAWDAKELALKISRLQKRVDKVTKGKGELPDLPPLNGIVIDNSEALAIGKWKDSTHSKPYLGAGYIHDENEDKGNKTLTFTPKFEESGEYDVFLAYTHAVGRASNVPVTLLHSGGEETVFVNEKEAPDQLQIFHRLGTFRFEVGNQAYVMVSNEGTDGYVVADAVVFVPKGKPLTKEEPKDVEAVRPLVAELDELKKSLKEIEAQLAKRPLYLAVKGRVEPTNCPIHIRGSVHQLGEKVRRGVPRVGMETSYGNAFEVPSDEGGRLQFADWIISEHNTLTSRVMANRIWLWTMGAGIVRTPDNFGTTGDEPTHPELLDLLARKLVSSRWSAKSLVREIVLSEVYQQTSSPSTDIVSRDPENKEWRYAFRKKLTAEQLRDAMLSVSGELEKFGGGPSPQLASDFDYVHKTLERSVYVPVFRNALPDLYNVFDFPEPSYTSGRRNESVIPSQSLFLLNSPFVSQRAEATARKQLVDKQAPLAERIETVYLLSLGRSPTTAERSIAVQYFDGVNHDDLNAWTLFVHSLLASPDFRYLN